MKKRAGITPGLLPTQWRLYSLRRIAADLGIEYLPMYAARHSAATHLRDAGVPAALVSAMLGTSEAMLHQHYYGGAGGDVADALRKLG